MNDRMLTALRSAGFDVRPTATLDKESAFFALSDDILIYLEGPQATHVMLRDITRIHSDNQGVLRVDTPAGNAITASLLGYDVSRVQHFFGEVKNATARAKSPPRTGGGGSPWKTGWAVNGGAGGTGRAPSAPPAASSSPETAAGTTPPVVTPAPVTPPAATPSTAPALQKPMTVIVTPSASAEGAAAARSTADTSGGAASTGSASGNAASAGPASGNPASGNPGSGNPVPTVTVTSPGTATPPSEGAGVRADLSKATTGSVTAGPSGVRPAGATAPAEQPTAAVTIPSRAPVTIPGPSAPAVTSGEPARVPDVSPPASVRTAPRDLPDLRRFTPTLRLLAVLMGLTGLMVGVLEYQQGGWARGLWTFGGGAVGAFALYVFGEVVKVLAVLAERGVGPTDLK